MAKTGKTAGLTAVKTSLKTGIKEGVEQGVKNLDNLKGILKSTKGLGDNVYQSLSTYRKQLAHHIQNTVDEGVLNLSKAAQEGLERAKQFTLEVPTIRTKQLATVDSVNVQTFSRLDTTTVKLGDTGLGKGLDNLASKAKQVENTRLDKLRARNAFYGTKVDDVVWDASEELSNLRRKWKVPETDTIAVGKTNVPGLEGKVFEGGSPKVRKEAGLPDLDDAFPDREIKSPRKNAFFTRHAEENVIQDFVRSVEELGLPDDEIEGVFKLHQSNSSGVCGACKQGLTNPNVSPGILKQFSEKFPNLTIEVTTESAEIGSKLNFIIKNGQIL